MKVGIYKSLLNQQTLNMDETEYRNNKGTTINHFYEKLLLIKNMMNGIIGKDDIND